MRQFVEVKFRPDDTRAYTYHYDLPSPVRVGDVMKAPGRDGDGWQRVTVTRVNLARPSFQTRGLLGHAPKEENGK